MRIVFGFVGGGLDNSVLAYDTAHNSENGEVKDYYELSGNGTVGKQFNVPHENGIQAYEVVMRLENGGNVIVRASYVG